jgi:hypothetical protein
VGLTADGETRVKGEVVALLMGKAFAESAAQATITAMKILVIEIILRIARKLLLLYQR